MPIPLHYVAFGKSNREPWFNEVWSTYLSPTEADVERMEVFGALGGEAGAVHQGPHRPHGAEVEAQGHVAVRVAELTVAET